MSDRLIRYDHAGNIILCALRSAPPVQERRTEGTPFRVRRIVTGRLPRLRVPAAALALLSSGNFFARFAVTFAILFALLNAQSFYAILRARVLPDADHAERTALEAMTREGFSPSSLLAAPMLPVAGRTPHRILAERLRVAPPDNRLIIPDLTTNVPLVEATDAALRRNDFKTFERDIQDALRFGVVRYPGTAEPGNPGNVFMTGHSAYLFWDSGGYKEVFARLSELQPGDTYAIAYEGELYHYRVTKAFEVSPKDTSVLAQPPNKRMSTLMTCSPVGTTLRRLIVQAEEIDPSTGTVLVVTAEQSSSEAIRMQDLGGELPGWGNGLSL